MLQSVHNDMCFQSTHQRIHILAKSNPIYHTINAGTSESLFNLSNHDYEYLKQVKIKQESRKQDFYIFPKFEALLKLDFTF